MGERIAMEFLTANISTDGSVPIVGIEFGHALSGGYRLYLIDTNNGTMNNIGDGHNGDQKPDHFPVGPTTSAVVGTTIQVDANVASPTVGGTFSVDSNAGYSATIYIEQDGNRAFSHVFSGQLDDGVGSILAQIDLEPTAGEG
jgi:hypothetical protein